MEHGAIPPQDSVWKTHFIVWLNGLIALPIYVWLLVRLQLHLLVTLPPNYASLCVLIPILLTIQQEHVCRLVPAILRSRGILVTTRPEFVSSDVHLKTTHWLMLTLRPTTDFACRCVRRLLIQLSEMHQLQDVCLSVPLSLIFMAKLPHSPAHHHALWIPMLTLTQECVWQVAQPVTSNTSTPIYAWQSALLMEMYLFMVILILVFARVLAQMDGTDTTPWVFVCQVVQLTVYWLTIWPVLNCVL